MVTFLIFTLLAALTSAQVILPSQDPFYSEPENINTFSPGQVIRSRTVPNNLNGFFKGGPSTNVNTTYQYLYRTTDSLGNPIAAVTTLLVPHNADRSKLLAYQTAYDSANNNCSPSYALQAGANTTAVADIVFITAALNNGWYVVTSDYEGLNAHYTAGIVSGYATLDSVRAAFNEVRTSGLSSTAKYAMWGYSGGSLASEWAAELQPKYAPELKFEGVALGGLIPNVTSVLFTINRGPFTGLAFSGILGLTKTYPKLKTYLEQHLIPEKSEEFYGIANGCIDQTALQGAFKDVFIYTDLGANILNDPIPRSVLAASGQMGVSGTPTIPMYVYKAIADEVSPGRDTDLLVEKLCKQGAIIQYRKNIIGEHISEAITGSANAFGWIADRLDGKPVTQKRCRTEVVALTALDIATVPSLGKEIIALLQALFGGRTGPLLSG